MNNTALYDNGHLTINAFGVSETFKQKKIPAFVVVRDGNAYSKSGLSYTVHASFALAVKAREARAEGGYVLTVHER